jgi:transcriptional regulator with XRE-family HTH domain
VADTYGREITRHLADLIQLRREAAGLSLEALADAADMHRTSVGLIVRGERGLTVDRAASLAKALGVRLSDLIAEAELRAHGSD